LAFGSLQRSPPDPFAEMSNILLEIITEMLQVNLQRQCI